MQVETLGAINLRINSINETNGMRISPRKFRPQAIKDIVSSFIFSHDLIKLSVIKGEKKIGQISRRHLDLMRTLTDEQRANLLDQIAVRIEAADSVLIESMSPWKYI